MGELRTASGQSPAHREASFPSTGPTALGRLEAHWLWPCVRRGSSSLSCCAGSSPPAGRPRTCTRTAGHRAAAASVRLSLARCPKNSGHLEHPKSCTLSIQVRMLPCFMWVALRCLATFHPCGLMAELTWTFAGVSPLPRLRSARRAVSVCPVFYFHLIIFSGCLSFIFHLVHCVQFFRRLKR